MAESLDHVGPMARCVGVLLREFSATSTRPTELPTGRPLLEGDVLSRVEFKGGPVFLIGREAFPMTSWGTISTERKKRSAQSNIALTPEGYRYIVVTAGTASARDPVQSTA